MHNQERYQKTKKQEDTANKKVLLIKEIENRGLVNYSLFYMRKIGYNITFCDLVGSSHSKIHLIRGKISFSCKSFIF